MRAIHSWLGLGRYFLLVVSLLLGLFWVSSYFIGFQGYRSKWSTSEAGDSEDAKWFVSNFGSIGIGWRSQAGELGSAAPPNESELKKFDGSSSALNHVHPEGFLAWHWVHYEPTQTTVMGTMRGGYGHLYIPYWMLFLAGGFLTFSAAVWIKRRAKKPKKMIYDRAMSRRNS